MLRALSRLGAGTPCGPRAPLVLPARGRKTRYDPPAKSKIGRVNMPPPVDPAEFFVLMERYQHYRQTVRALRMEFVSEVRRKAYEARAGVLAERKALKYATEHRELMAWNQEENRRLHNLRIARLRQEEREQEQRQALEQARKAEEVQAWVQRKEREVLQLQVGNASGGWDSSRCAACGGLGILGTATPALAMCRDLELAGQALGEERVCQSGAKTQT
ncbi:PREDICTED: 28S ribosomal protein S26, mitochondrial isoform X1 [Colobus angolensis palliatus]|uniref:28S ribosomal protein S26, mitochondrial isoform X1 n=1 Tax=Colobus angolensis palliatus TaxID=336983 RepID=UPI0005F57349|nr:PREDICTED: 28S ribosomal protein S26, mitochondrial isoform X1 [Colobus angolensis palliatus]